MKAIKINTKSVGSPDQITDVDFLVNSFVTARNFLGINVQRKNFLCLKNRGKGAQQACVFSFSVFADTHSRKDIYHTEFCFNIIQSTQIIACIWVNNWGSRNKNLKILPIMYQIIRTGIDYHPILINNLHYFDLLYHNKYLHLLTVTAQAVKLCKYVLSSDRLPFQWLS